MEMRDMSVNAPARPTAGAMDVDEFMAFLQTRPKEERWHLIEGVAVRMAPRSLAHQRIAQNLCELLNGAFTADKQDLFAYHEIAIRRPGLANFQPEPDVVVAPGTAAGNSRAASPNMVANRLRVIASKRAHLSLAGLAVFFVVLPAAFSAAN
jgi:Uma2 family endonuclease